MLMFLNATVRSVLRRHGATIVSLAALVFSLWTFVGNEAARHRDLSFETVQKSYQTYFELGRIQLEHWQLSHLLALPDRYAHVVGTVRAATRTASTDKQAEYLLKERALADYIFTFYEQTLYQWDVTKVSERRFLTEILNYLTGRLLRNPRLLYYWAETGGGLEHNYEELTRKHYRENVLNSPAAPLSSKPDAEGPFTTSQAPRP